MLFFLFYRGRVEGVFLARPGTASRRWGAACSVREDGLGFLERGVRVAYFRQRRFAWALEAPALICLGWGLIRRLLCGDRFASQLLAVMAVFLRVSRACLVFREFFGRPSPAVGRFGGVLRCAACLRALFCRGNFLLALANTIPFFSVFFFVKCGVGFLG